MRKDKKTVKLLKPLDVLIAEHVFKYEIIETYLQFLEIFSLDHQKQEGTIAAILLHLEHLPTGHKQFRQILKLDKDALNEKLGASSYVSASRHYRQLINAGEDYNPDQEAMLIAEVMARRFGYNAIISIYPEGLTWKQIDVDEKKDYKVSYSCFFQKRARVGNTYSSDKETSFYNIVAQAALDILAVKFKEEFIEAVED